MKIMNAYTTVRIRPNGSPERLCMNLVDLADSGRIQKMIVAFVDDEGTIHIENTPMGNLEAIGLAELAKSQFLER